MFEMNNNTSVDTTKVLYSLPQLHVSTLKRHHQANIRAF